MTWTAIVVTRRHGSQDVFIEQELELLQTQGVLPAEAALLVVEDACPDVGSGGSTLNALLVVAEHLCARRGFTVLNEHVLKDAKILIIHLGRPFLFDPRGAAFLDLNADFVSASSQQIAMTPFISQYTAITALAAASRPGVWISGSDSFWQLESTDGILEWPECDLTAFTVSVTREFAKNHGMYTLDSDNNLMDIVYQAPFDGHSDESKQKVPLVVTLMHMSVKAATQLLSLHSQYPLSASTYLGIDSGCVGLKLSLFFDFLLPTCSNISETDFCSGMRAGSRETTLCKCETREDRMADLSKARKLLWNCFSKLQSKAVFLNTSCYHYFTNKPDDMVAFVNDCLKGDVSSFADVCKFLHTPTFRNVSNEHTDVRIHSIYPASDNDVIVFAANIANNRDFESSQVNDFQNFEGDAFSVDDVFRSMNNDYYFISAREYKVDIWLAEVSRVLNANAHTCLLPIFRSICSFNDAFLRNRLFKLLDDIAFDSKSTRIAGRAMSCVADVLGILANNQGGLRSGPAANKEFVEALSMLQVELTTEQGIRKLRQVCDKWMDTPSRLIRAARHYEAAAQIFTRRTVMYCKK
uniref:L-fucokinase domain-containing protein n=1 Tax=Plectus sambesii TaxID=2011161 RepID=A0A914XFS8_9BILA